MLRPVEVEPRSRYVIWIRYADGTEGEVDLSHLAGRGVFKLWEDRDQFEQVHVAEHGAIQWTEEVELCPDATYMKLTGKTVDEVLTVRSSVTHA